MPKRTVLPENDTRDSFLVIWEHDSHKHIQEYVGLRNAVIGYRQFRSLYGDGVRLARVVLNYGTEI